MLRGKELEIARAFVYFIQKRFPEKTQKELAVEVNMTPSNFNRLFHFTALPSLQKLIEIETKYLNMDIIKVVLFDDKDLITERIERIEKALQLTNDSNYDNNPKIMERPMIEDNLYQQIMNDPYYSLKFERLIQKIENVCQGILKQRNLYFKVRRKRGYVSINLIPLGMVTSGVHVLMFRHYQANHSINIEFIKADFESFKDCVLQYSELVKTMVEKGKAILVLKIKNRSETFHLYQGKGENTNPFLVFSRPWVDDDIDLIEKLVKWMLPLQK